MRFAALALFAAVCQAAWSAPSPLPPGAAAPDFHLPGVDGKTWSLADFKDAKALVVVFTSVHCPTAQVYEDRIAKLAADYRDKGVAFAVIEPTSPRLLGPEDLGYTDAGVSLADMKTRAAYRKFAFPFLYDGETQEASQKYGPTATPHVFVFNAERKLAYQGALDSNPREAQAREPYARNAIDAALAGKPSPVESTPAVGTRVRWLPADPAPAALPPARLELARATAPELAALRANATGKTVLVTFWATWCGPCADAFPALSETYRMYRRRPFEFAAVSLNTPDEEPAVRRFLEAQRSPARNLILGSRDAAELIRAFDPEWNGGAPYTVLLAPGGKVLYKETGPPDTLKLRRAILASFPEDDLSGQRAYWNRP